MQVPKSPNRSMSGSGSSEFSLPPRYSASSYLPHIDGLRALSVGAVLIYHVNPAWLPGGFAGVDLFFVISGFLITRLLVAEIDTGSFSLLQFWERRARRILPPSLAVISATLLCGLLLFSPGELAGLGASATAAVLSAGNLYFWLTSGGYFALNAHLLPLLHTWSLGVEEQFYLAYPIIVIAVASRRPRSLLPLVAVGSCISLGAAIYASHSHTSANFYLPFTRAWELGAGCLLALRRNALPKLSVIPATSLVAMALAAIFLTFGFADANTWPGLSTVPLIAACCVLIAFVPAVPALHRLLSSPPLRGLGLISYGTYLWHYPMLSIARVVGPNQPSPAVLVVLALCSVGMGALSYRFIEMPVRDRQRLRSRSFWSQIAVAVAIVAASGAYLWARGGLLERLPPRLAAVSQMGTLYPARLDPCFYAPDVQRSFDTSCTRGTEGHAATAVIGDSHAMALAPGFDNLLKRTGTRARLLIAAGCPPVIERRIMSELQGHCAPFAERTLNWLERNKSIRVVVIAARWPYTFTHDFYDNGEGGVEFGPDDRMTRDPMRDKLFVRSVHATIARMLAANKAVALIYPVPEPGWDVPKYLVHSYLKGRPSEMPTIDFARWSLRAAPAVAMLDAYPNHPRLVRIRPAQALCRREFRGRCHLGERGWPFYFDDDHPNTFGARVMIERGTSDLGLARLADAMRASKGEEAPGGEIP